MKIFHVLSTESIIKITARSKSHAREVWAVLAGFDSYRQYRDTWTRAPVVMTPDEYEEYETHTDGWRA